MVLEQRDDCQAEFISALAFHLFIAERTTPSPTMEHSEWEDWLFACISLLEAVVSSPSAELSAPA